MLYNGDFDICDDILCCFLCRRSMMMVMMMTFTDLLWFISSSAILLVKYWSTAVMLNISCQSWRYQKRWSWLCLPLRFLEETTVGVAITSQCFVATHTVLLTSKHLQRTTWSSKTNTWVLLNNNTLLVGFDFYGRTRWTTSCYRNVFLLLVLIQNSPSTSQQGTPGDSSGHLFLGRLSVTDWAGICYSQHIAPELNITNTYASTNRSMYKQYYKCAT